MKSSIDARKWPLRRILKWCIGAVLFFWVFLYNPDINFDGAREVRETPEKPLSILVKDMPEGVTLRTDLKLCHDGRYALSPYTLTAPKWISFLPVFRSFVARKGSVYVVRIGGLDRLMWLIGPRSDTMPDYIYPLMER